MSFSAVIIFFHVQLKILRILLFWIFSENKYLNANHYQKSNEILVLSCKWKLTETNSNNQNNAQLVTNAFDDALEILYVPNLRK